MLDESQRAAILELKKKGHGVKPIARMLGVAKKTVREVLRSGQAEVPRVMRAEKAEPHREQILELSARCGGNLVRVHEELLAQGAELSYQALTAFCRRHEIGRKPRPPSGRYTFGPGEEMQHDTSPYDVLLGGVKRRVQAASLVLCFSRMVFIQLFLSFTRFDCKVFLQEALEYFGGACRRCMIDNTHVVVLRGTGKDMVPVPEMEAFGERLGFVFRAHAVGDCNRSARVEGHFNYFERNFLGGRQFEDLEDLNRQALAWCDRANAKWSRKLHASRIELFAAERSHLMELPAWVPPIYRLHQRIADVEGYVNVHSNRYSAPYRLIGRQLEVRETKERIEIFDGPRKVAEHPKLLEPRNARVTCPEHRPPRGEGRAHRDPSAEEEELLRREPRLGPFIAALKKKHGGPAVLPLRRVRRLLRDYPREPLVEAAARALAYGMLDLERLERMVLRLVARQYFNLPDGRDEG